MSSTAYFNVISTISLSPSVAVETPVNSNTFMQDPTSSAGTAFVANLNFTANCGLPNYSVSCTGGGSVSPTSGVTNNQNVRYSPTGTTGTSTVTFTDSTTPTAQTASQTVYNIVPVDVAGSWGYHTCVKYSHSTYGSGLYKLKCWGLNSNGQLGYGDTNARGNATTEIGYGLGFIKNTGTSGADMIVKDVSLGLNHTCVILNDDTVKCWGLNTSGQLGYNNTTSSLLLRHPQLMSALELLKSSMLPVIKLVSYSAMIDSSAGGGIHMASSDRTTQRTTAATLVRER